MPGESEEDRARMWASGTSRGSELLSKNSTVLGLIDSLEFPPTIPFTLLGVRLVKAETGEQLRLDDHSDVPRIAAASKAELRQSYVGRVAGISLPQLLPLRQKTEIRLREQGRQLGDQQCAYLVLN